MGGKKQSVYHVLMNLTQYLSMIANYALCVCSYSVVLYLSVLLCVATVCVQIILSLSTSFQLFTN